MQQPLSHPGLTAAQVAESRALHGANILTPPERTPLWRRFLGYFCDPLIVILLVAGVLSVGIAVYEQLWLGEPATVYFEPVGIFVAILLSTGMSFYFETRAEGEFNLLNRVADDERVVVRRSEGLRRVARRDVVVGDIVLLPAGCEVPADGCLMEAVRLMVDESTLTGEPQCRKTTDEAQFDPDATFPSNHVLRGTKVMEGHGQMCVTAVGDHTENGRVFTAAQIDDGTRTPLDEQLVRLGRMVAWFSYAVALLIVGGRYLHYTWLYDVAPDAHFFTYMLQSVMLAVTLVVVSVPEGLPMAVTMSLAYSMRRMLKTNNLVRRLHACETMGAITVICTDKTGTLTENRMQVTDCYTTGSEPLLRETMALCSTTHLEGGTVIGNPTEGALLLWLEAHGTDYRALRRQAPLRDETPFTTEHKYMAVEALSPSTGRPTRYVKGAPEVVMAMAGYTHQEVERLLAQWQGEAKRTLAFAAGDVGAELQFIGIVGIADPVRADVPAAVDECHRAGIEIKIVTGDTPATAREVGRQIGIEAQDDEIITGPDFAALTDDELSRRVLRLKIIARARPMDKRRLVEALQRAGQVVAVTGDGTNDAPALKAAHVGLSMGDGTSVAREASDITIIDNSFASIGRAVMWGRSLYQNIQRFILFQLTVNVVACLTVLFGAFLDTASPLTVTQMLWVNLIMDTFAAMALSILPPVARVMKKRPRDRRRFIITFHMWRSILGTGAIFTALSFLLLYTLEHCSVTSALSLFLLSTYTPAGHGLTPYELTLFFTFFVMLQFWNLFNARCYGSGESFFRAQRSRSFEGIALCIGLGQLLIVEVGGRLFNVVPAFTFPLGDFLVVALVTSLVLWVRELHILCMGKRLQRP